MTFHLGFTVGLWERRFAASARDHGSGLRWRGGLRPSSARTAASRSESARCCSALPAGISVLFLLMEDTFDVRQLIGEARVLFDHAAAQAHFGASVFWLRRLAALGGEEQAIAGWQIKRDGTYRGIIEIVEEQT